MLRQLHLAPTLRELVLGRMQNLDAMGLEYVVDRLPATLERLVLRGWPLAQSAAISVLARFLPPRIKSLGLTECSLTTADLDQFAGRWPLSLRELNLSANRLTIAPMDLPPHLQVLKLRDNVTLNDACGVAWVERLPTSLRVLNLTLTHVQARTAAALLAHVPISADARRRLCVLITVKRIVPALVSLMEKKFDVVVQPDGEAAAEENNEEEEEENDDDEEEDTEGEDEEHEEAED
ncbi:hypothetical protein GGF32_010014 [Allomyces javanicus]|nr:hypothetical protein GGF32_010014 [Allomyces javanicus]